MVLLLAIMLTFMGSTLYQLQINEGDAYYRRSQYKIAETQTMDAARGNIYDRNGQVLVSNKAVYQVTLDPKLMGDDRNDIILRLIRVARECGVEWNDSLPITMEPPFTYTDDSAFLTTVTEEDGTETQSLTRLGRLSVLMDWIQDPLAQPEALPEPEEPGFFDRLQALFTDEEDSRPIPVYKEEGLPTADRLLGKMCRSFDVRGPGAVPNKSVRDGRGVPTMNIGLMDARDARAVAGVLYELYLRSQAVYHVPYVFAEDVDIDFISRVKELSLNGVIIEATSIRQYNTTYAAHLLGRTGPIFEDEWETYRELDLDGDGEPDYEMDDIVGKDGVESAFERHLRGKPGVRTVERNTDGKIVSSTWLEEPQPGDNVVLTLDIGLQAHVENVMAEMLPTVNDGLVEGAACVVLDVKTADVLASASYPTFDPNTYNEDYQKNYEDPLNPMFNRALRGIYAPGSTFKPVTAIAGLEEGVIRPDTIINATGVYTYYPGFHPRCWSYWMYGYSHGPINVSQALEVSCNYFFFDVGRRLGIERIQDYAARFGLGQKTGLELYEEEGVMAGPEFTESMGGTWYEGNTLSVAIGQESSQFTPTQIANYAATLANGGTRHATHLLKETKSSDFTQIKETYEPRVLSQFEIKPENMQAVKKGMHDLTMHQLGPFFSKLPVDAAAKTGSAQVAAKNDSNAVFICFAPLDDPQVALAMVAEQGSSGTKLAPLAVEILNYYFTAQEARDVISGENVLIP